jgi:RNA polymerase sigma-70 factor (ECF subfamily)
MYSRSFESAQEKFDTLILPNRTALMTQARRLTRGDLAEAEDLVQETLLRAYTRLDTITSEATLAGWLHTILKNLYINRYRRRLSQRAISLSCLHEELMPFTDDDETVPETAAIRHGEQRAAYRALHALPAAYRTPIVLADIEMLSYQDIAAQLALPIGTVRSRLARGRRRLRRSLYAWDGPPS